MTKKGEERYDIVFPKYKKGGYIVRKVVQDPTYGRLLTYPHANLIAYNLLTVCLTYYCIGYIDELIKETVTLSSKGGSTPHFTEPTSQPKSLSSGYEKPENVSAILRHKSRFSTR